MSLANVWIGVIWAVVMGLAMGNYACSLVHRLPRGLSLLAKTPYCGTCGASLQVRDLFPVISAVLLGHKCRYCKTPFPISHTVTELLVMAIFILSFLQYNFVDKGILIATIGTFLIALAAIEVNSKIIMWQVMLAIIVAGMLLRTLIDHNLFFFVQGGLLAAIIGAIIWRKEITKVGHVYRLPKKAELLVVAGICVGLPAFPQFLLVFAISYATTWLLARIAHKRPHFTIPFAFSLLAVLLYGQAINSLLRLLFLIL